MDDTGPEETDGQYHLAVTEADVAETVLLPGDPDRVETITDCWTDSEVVADHREYRTATGSYDGVPLSVTATGIGSPSAAIAVEELAAVGAETFIRVGSCGAIQPGIEVGDLIVTRAAVRQEGTSAEYVRPAYPAAADDRVVGALVAAAEELGHDYHVGLTASTDSFYAGQGRAGYGGFRSTRGRATLEELREAGVLNLEMEASAVLTLSSLFGLRAGALCVVYADRTAGEFRVTGERRAAETASRAAAILTRMDERVESAGVDRWHPGLGY